MNHSGIRPPSLAPPVKVILAVVQSADAEETVAAVTALRLRVTTIHSTGGFLRQGNQTLFCGVESARVAEVLEALRRTCRHRLEYVAVPLEGGNMPFAFPMEVEVGGATVFVFAVERYEEI